MADEIIFYTNPQSRGRIVRCSTATLAALCMLVTFPATGPAQTTVDKTISLTIYNDNLALIEHVRPLDLAAGRHRIEFAGVSAGIISQTVSFAAPGVQLIEQNFDYDLLTPAKLMEKAVGEEVELVRTNPGTGTETRETAEVLSTVGGVVLRIDNRIEVLREDGIPSRVIFDQVPPNLRASPTLSILADVAAPVDADARLAYLSRGLSWHADYVAILEDAQTSLDIQGWITLENQSGTTFENANAQLVAGDINLVEGQRQWWQQYNMRRRAGGTRLAAGIESSDRAQIADYYVYPLAEPTTIANNQTKQVSFLSAAGVAADRGYEQSFYSLESLPEPVSADVRIRFSNSGAAGLGDQLPSGVVRVYARDARDQPQFIGEDLIGHTSAGSDLAIKVGDAFDVTIQPTLVEATRASRRETDFEMSYLVRNARAEPVTVTIRQDDLARFNELRDESIAGRRTDADSFAWDVAVPANDETELRFTVRERR